MIQQIKDLFSCRTGRHFTSKTFEHISQISLSRRLVSVHARALLMHGILNYWFSRTIFLCFCYPHDPDLLDSFP